MIVFNFEQSHSQIMLVPMRRGNFTFLRLRILHFYQFFCLCLILCFLQRRYLGYRSVLDLVHFIDYHIYYINSLISFTNFYNNMHFLICLTFKILLPDNLIVFFITLCLILFFILFNLFLFLPRYLFH